MKTLGVVVALSAEARALGRTRHPEVKVAVSGIGSSAAAASANTLIDAGVAALMTFGMAGGLDPTLAAGSVLLPAEVIDRHGTRFATARVWRERLSAALSGHCSVGTGMVLTVGRSIDSPRDKAAAFRETGATAVDMESVSVARIAADHHLPFICVRVIVDTAADALPRAVQMASRSGQVQITQLLAGLLVQPRDLVPLLRLAQRYRSALRALRTVARSEALVPFDSEVRFA